MGEGKVAFITGSSKGIGEHIAYELAKSGVEHIILHGRNQKDLDRVAEHVEQLECRTSLVLGELSEVQTYEQVVRAVQARGKLDYFVNNAGVFELVKPLSDVPTTQHIIDVYNSHARMMNANMLPAAVFSHILHPFLQQSEQPKALFVLSDAELLVLDDNISYAATKEGVRRISIDWYVNSAKEGKPIHTYRAYPGNTETPGNQGRDVAYLPPAFVAERSVHMMLSGKATDAYMTPTKEGPKIISFDLEYEKHAARIQAEDAVVRVDILREFDANIEKYFGSLLRSQAARGR